VAIAPGIPQMQMQFSLSDKLSSTNHGNDQASENTKLTRNQVFSRDKARDVVLSKQTHLPSPFHASETHCRQCSVLISTSRMLLGRETSYVLAKSRSTPSRICI